MGRHDHLTQPHTALQSGRRWRRVLESREIDQDFAITTAGLLGIRIIFSHLKRIAQRGLHFVRLLFRFRRTSDTPYYVMSAVWIRRPKQCLYKTSLRFPASTNLRQHHSLVSSSSQYRPVIHDEYANLRANYRKALPLFKMNQVHILQRLPST